MSQGEKDQVNSEKFNSYKVEQIEELKEIFKMYDRNNTGNITSRTLKFLLRGLGDNVSEEEVDTKLKEMDEDGNGTIDFHEFLLYMLEKINKQNLCSDIIEIFKIFDREDSGFLTKTEIKIITRGLIDDHTIDKFCEEADIDNEGEINYKTFLTNLLV
jgi:Ca2+-binding EF-hand superfamily protein